MTVLSCADAVNSVDQDKDYRVVPSIKQSQSQPRKTVSFALTPRMPSYAFGFWVGPFVSHMSTSPVMKMPVTIYGVKSKLVRRSDKSDDDKLKSEFAMMVAV